jgi:DNA ligase-1
MLAKDYKDCKKLDELLKDGIFVSPKLDGYRCIAVCYYGNVVLYSRNGVEYQNFPRVVETLERWSKDAAFVLDGEIMSDDFNAMQQTAMSSKSNKTVGDVKFHVFGYIHYAEWEADKFKAPTELRLNTLKLLFNDKHLATDPIVMVEHERAYRLDRVMELMKEYLDVGYEGAMGLPNIPYFKGKKSNKLMKFKKFDNWDCEILDKYEGTGKYIGTLGGVTVLQPNGVKCDMGSGFNDADRDYIWNNFDEIKGRIVEAQYQGLTPDNKMRFPIFARWRSDKDTW